MLTTTTLNAHARVRLRDALDHLNVLTLAAQAKGEAAMGELAGAAAEAVADAMEALDEGGARGD